MIKLSERLLWMLLPRSRIERHLLAEMLIEPGEANDFAAELLGYEDLDQMMDHLRPLNDDPA